MPLLPPRPCRYRQPPPAHLHAKVIWQWRPPTLRRLQEPAQFFPRYRDPQCPLCYCSGNFAQGIGSQARRYAIFTLPAPQQRNHLSLIYGGAVRLRRATLRWHGLSRRSATQQGLRRPTGIISATRPGKNRSWRLRVQPRRRMGFIPGHSCAPSNAPFSPRRIMMIKAKKLWFVAI